MAGDLGGVLYNDLNANGLKDASDPGLAGWVVFVDVNKDGKLSAGEPNAISDSKGKYVIAGLPVGSVTVYEQPQAGFVPGTGFTDHQTINIREGRTVKADFPNVTAPITRGDVNGSVFDDTNFNNTKDSGEHGLLGWTVFVDSNNDGILNDGEPSQITDSDGDYRFADILSGRQTIVEIPQGGYVPIGSAGSLFPLEGASPSRVVTVVAGSSVRADFANAYLPTGTIEGHVWNDENGDGVAQSTESGIAGRSVFVDLNSNGMQDASEPSRITDAVGAYSFVDIRVGTFRLVESVPDGFVPSVGRPSAFNVTVRSGATTTADFFNLIPTVGSVRGQVFNDVNSDGVLTAPEPGLEGWQVYIDANNNGQFDPSELTSTTDLAGNFALDGVPYGSLILREVTQPGFTATSPSVQNLILLNGENRTGVSFGNHEPLDFSVAGMVFHDANQNGIRDLGENGLSGVTLFIDSNGDGLFNNGEPSVVSSSDLYYTPSVDETGTYSFPRLARGSYQIVAMMPDYLSATPEGDRMKVVSLGPTSQSDVDFAARFRANEIHGVVFDDTNANHSYDLHEHTRPAVSIYIDSNRNNSYDDGEPTAVTDDHGAYSFAGLTPGAYIVRERYEAEVGPHTYPRTGGGTLWPDGSSHPAIGNVSSDSITVALDEGQVFTQTVSLTLPTTGNLTNLVDVFLLFDDTGSFTTNSPIVRAAFPSIIDSLRASLPGLDLGFGVGRFEEYGSFAGEYSTGRPFILNQPIVASSTPGFLPSIQAALDRVAPGYGGDQPETDIEALYQLVTGAGFDGNANGSVLDSGRAGLASTQQAPGMSGDVPAFESFTADPVRGVLPAAGNLGGGGFRSGALPIILLATDTGFAFQPKGEIDITGVGGLTVPLSALTQVSRGTTPFGKGAGIQETITGLNALGGLVIGLGTNPDAAIDPRKGLEAISKLTGAVNNSSSTIANGTLDPIAPGDPLYFQITTGFGSSVADGVVNAIQNAVTNVAMDITVRASDPRVHLINKTGTILGVGAGGTAAFDIEFTGDGRPHRFDIEFVRAGTGVVLGSIPVVFGATISGDGYSYDELEDGEIHRSSHFGNYVANVSPTFIAGPDVNVLEDSLAQVYPNWASNISPGATWESNQSVEFLVTNDNSSLFSIAPTISPDGTLTFKAAPDANGLATIIVRAHDNGGVGLDGTDTSPPYTFSISITAANDAPIAVRDTFDAISGSDLLIPASGVLQNDNDVDGDAINASLVSAPTHGTIVLARDGSFIYTSDLGYAGFDQFSYVANDGRADSEVTIVTIRVTGANSDPVASDDSYVANEDTRLTVTAPGILANDSDFDSDPLTTFLVEGTAFGALTLNVDGSFSYLPSPNWNGIDRFTYRVSDGTANSNLATVILNFQPINDAPVAQNDTYEAIEDNSLVINTGSVLSNDYDVDDTALQAMLVIGPSHGSIALSPDGTFVYTPAANYNGVDRFIYRVSDGKANSNLATVGLHIAPVNDAPIANDDEYAIDQGKVLTIPARGILGNDLDADGDVLVASMITSPSNGTLALGGDGSFRYTPSSSFSGVDSFTYQASDATSSSIATVRIHVIATVPPTKFFVADIDNAASFNYAEDGRAVNNFNLGKAASKPHGIAANATGTTLWVVDESGNVFVYDNEGVQLGQWQATGLRKPEGITVWGNDLWIVDKGQDRVYKFIGGASLRSGRIAPTSSFGLAGTNLDAMDIVTDGAHIWVVNDIVGVDKVFRYSMAGALQGSWSISSTNPSPTGITIDPNNVNHIWIVDASTDRVYQYNSGTTLLSGIVEPSSFFPLAATNTNPQGIADPADPRKIGTQVNHNFAFPIDVDDDSRLSPLDALSVINRINGDSSQSNDDLFHDVDDDSIVSPLDALMVINAINANRERERGESSQFSQASSVRATNSTSRARVELEKTGNQAELKIRVDQALASATLPVQLNGIPLGNLTTDSRGRGEIRLHAGDDHTAALQIPEGLELLSPEMELIIGDILQGSLSQVAKVESQKTPANEAEANLSLVAPFPVVNGVRRSAQFEQEVENGQSKRKLQVEIENAVPKSRFDIVISGVTVGSVATDSRGKGKVTLSSHPRDSREGSLPTGFPIIESGTRIEIGSESSLFQR